MKINVTRSSMPSYEEYCNEIKDIWESRWLTNNGPKHNLLEKELSAYLDVENTTLFVNGHHALEIALASYNFPRGSEVITTPFTFVSTTNSIVRCGLTPIFCDINEKDYTIDANKIEELITDKTVAIVPVHVYGNVCDVEKIEKIAKKFNLKVVYDAAHAFGVKYKGKGICNYGDISMLSFHATKVFNTIEGGALCYNNRKFTEVFKSMKNFGLSTEENCNFVGGNSKMNEFAASMGLCNLRHISEYIKNREKAVAEYRNRLGSVKGIKVCDIQKDVEQNFSYFPVLFDGYKYNRDEVKRILEEHDIGSRKYFYPCTNEFESLKKFNNQKTPIAKNISSKILCLPLYSDLTIEQVDNICDLILR